MSGQAIELVDSNGQPTGKMRGTDGAGHVVLPQNSFGTISVGELAGTNTEASTIYSFANGLNGVTVENIMLLGGTDIDAELDGLMVYVAFNNTGFNDATVAGLRHVVGPNTSKAFSFNGTPKPTQMIIRIDASQCTAVYTAAEG